MRIVCATDLLPKTEPAVARAGSLADHLDAELTLLHIVEAGGPESILEESLQNALGQMRSLGRPPQWTAGRAPDIAVRAGNPARLLLETLQHPRADLAILGPHRKRPLRDVLEGTIAEKVLAGRSCPLLVVRNQAPDAYRRILLAIDLSSAAACALRAAESLILTPAAEARIVHAHEPPYQGMSAYVAADFATVSQYVEGWTRQAASSVRGLLESQSASPERYEVAIAELPPAPAICRAVEEYRPDLLVMGTRGGGRVHRALLGSVANRVMHEVACDALIVPEGSCGASQGLLSDRRNRFNNQQRTESWQPDQTPHHPPGLP